MLRSAIAGLGGLLLATSVLAQPAPEVRKACAADVMRLCADAAQDRRGRGQCLRQHWAEVSDACKSAIMARRGAMKGHPDEGPPSAGSPH